MLLVALIDTPAAMQISDTACQPEQAYLELLVAKKMDYPGIC
jgi:hypothetical protein